MTHLHSIPHHLRHDGAPEPGLPHRPSPRGAGSVSYTRVLAPASRPCRRWLLCPLSSTAASVDTGGSDAPSESLLRRGAAPAVPNLLPPRVTRTGGSLPGQRLRANRTHGLDALAYAALAGQGSDRLEAMSHKEVPLRINVERRQGAGSGGYVTDASVAHHQRPDTTTVAANPRTLFIASPRREHEMQTPRFSTVMVEKAEDLLDYVRHAASDGEICQTEIRTIDVMADDLYRHTQVNDANQADIIARLRTGPDSQRVRVTSREVRNSLRLIQGNGERRPDCHPNDAA